jgi:phenylalanyl-tRNA synthetase beta chain
MPVVELDINRLCHLIGRDLETQTLIEAISAMGADVEGSDGKIITVEFFPDRPDLLSVEGAARALRAFLGFEKGLKSYSFGPPVVDVNVEASVKPVREYIECLDVKGVRLDDGIVKGLMELQEDLHWALGRDRKKVAIGVHDSSRITPPYTYKAVEPDEVYFEPLGMPGVEMSIGEVLEKHPKGVEYAHIINSFDRYPVILDSKGNVLSMPPIINGELTKLTERTSQIFVEMTGTDDKAVKKAMNILTAAFAENGWRLSKVNVKYPQKTLITPDLNPERRGLSVGYTNKTLGLNLSPAEVKTCLEKTGYGVGLKGADLEVFVPAYRADILHDIDVVEDVAIGFGFQNFNPELPRLSTIGSRLSLEAVSRKARSSMLGLGFTEAVTLMLTNEENNALKMGVKEDSVKVKNPISEEHTIIRSHLLPSLLEVLNINRHRELPQRIFEVGDVLKVDSKQETGSRGERRLCACVIHPKANFSESKSLFTALLRDLGMRKRVKSMDHPSFIQGRCGGVAGLGYFGEIHPSVLTSFNLEYPTIGLEIVLT